jgi:hypothetical protein
MRERSPQLDHENGPKVLHTLRSRAGSRRATDTTVSLNVAGAIASERSTGLAGRRGAYSRSNSAQNPVASGAELGLSLGLIAERTRSRPTLKGKLTRKFAGTLERLSIEKWY